MGHLIIRKSALKKNRSLSGMNFSQWVIPDLKNYFPVRRHLETFLYSVNFGHVKTRPFKQVSFCIIKYLDKCSTHVSRHPALQSIQGFHHHLPSGAVVVCGFLWSKQDLLNKCHSAS